MPNCAPDHVRMDDAALAELRQRSAEANHSNAIEGIYPTPELQALFAMFLEERTSPDVFGPYVDRYIEEKIVPADRVPAIAEAV